MLIVHPHASEVSDGVDNFLFLFEFFNKLFIIDSIFLSYIFDFILIFFDKRDDGLSIVLRNVFGLVFESLFH